MRRTWLPLVAVLTIGAAIPAYAAPQAAPAGPAEVVLALPDQSTTGAPDAVAGVLDPLLDDASLGGSVGAIVLDVATGAVIYQREAAMPRSLASNQKVFTALAILDALGPEGRIETTVVWDSSTSTVTLVGAGDPTLASVAASGSSLADLADQVAGQVTGEVSLQYDTSLFDGPALAPGWAPEYPALGIAAPVSPLVVDRARIGGDEAARIGLAAMAGQRGHEAGLRRIRRRRARGWSLGAGRSAPCQRQQRSERRRKERGRRAARGKTGGRTGECAVIGHAPS